MKQKKAIVNCNGVKLFYIEKGKGNLTFLCIHNTGGDHRLFIPQLNFFSQFGRVLIPDLRGHGKSDKPKTNYSIEVFSQDLAMLCKRLAVRHVVAIGSSTGGNVALDLAYHYPSLVKAIIMIDSGIFLSTSVRQRIQEYQEKLSNESIAKVRKLILDDSCLPTDKYKSLMRNAYQQVSADVWKEVFASLLKWDKGSQSRLLKCAIPILYVQACENMHDCSNLANLHKFSKVYPALMKGKVVGTGHYPSLEAADQVNSMILQFLKLKLKHKNAYNLH